MSARVLVIVFAVSLCISGCSREKSDWRSAQAADTAESYQQFIDSHPDSTLVTSARERLAQLAEEKDWRAAAAVDSLEAYQKFLAQYPEGHWAKEARVRIDNFANSPGAGASATSGAAAAATPALPAGESPAGAGAALPDGGPPPVTAGFGVQLGAFSSAERANEEWKKLAASSAGTLDGLNPRVVVGEAGGKTIYRLQAEVRDEVQARAVCGGLKAANKPCVPVIPATHP